MKKNRKRFLIILIAIIVTLHTISFADVGSFDRYDSGSSGFSSSSSSWGSDYDSDGDILFIIGWLLGNNVGRGALLIIIIAFIIRLILNQKGGTTKSRTILSHSYQTNQPVVDLNQSHIYAQRIKNIDPNFSEEKMLAWAKDLFIKLQNAWTAREWETMRPFETESLFEQHQAQIQNYIDTNRINIVDRIAVNYATIYEFRQEGDRDILEIALKATKKDYIIDATTKQLLEGSKEQDRITVYKMTFERKTGILTEEGTAKIKTTNCPNCGAPTKITSAGKCEYCGSIITTGANGWVLSGLEPLRN